jgi:pullulanase/glycogen debranching enzyme
MRQIKNMFMTLMVSQGTPMMVMGDEYGMSRDGNNNAYGHDDWMTQFDWDKLEAERSTLFSFVSGASPRAAGRRLRPAPPWSPLTPQLRMGAMQG